MNTKTSSKSELDRRPKYTDFLDQFVNRTSLGLVLGLVFFFLWLPLVVIVIYSFSGSGTIIFPPKTWTLKYYWGLLNAPSIHGAVKNSLIIAVTAASIVTMLGILAGYALNKYNVPGKRYFESIALLPIIVPLIITGIGYVIFYSFFEIQFGMGTTIIAHSTYTFPFGVIIITSSIARVDRSLEEAAMDLGSSEFRVFRKVTLPLIVPGIFATWILAFTLSLNEFVITYFVSGTFMSTLPIWMWDQLRFGVTPLTYSISAVTLFVALGLVYAVHRVIGVQQIRG
ncbi:ABC transporter permease [Haladaptatus halobius]|uniref:ABC transporter permease n=1 Tax=Haladaptatus halobius TaxID=2884875 RepID=UPI001D09B72B|nr:ABC transporter permease [Haladaptatus halobius]